MPDLPPDMPVLPVRKLPPARPHRFRLVPDAATRAALAEELGLQGLSKLRFEGTVAAAGDRDWALEGHLGATVVQPCVISLRPVTTRIEEDVTRRFLHDWPPPEEAGEEVEMPEDESIDPLGSHIDLTAVLTEALALALPAYPRHAEAEGGGMTAAPPGAGPIEEEEVKPFAGLSALRKKMEEDGG